MYVERVKTKSMVDILKVLPKVFLSLTHFHSVRYFL